MAGLDFEWNEAKNQANIAKHGVSFNLARGAFADTFAIEHVDDGEHHGEERYYIIGVVDGRLLYVACIMRGDVIRIISARGATRLEQRKYHEEDR